MRQSSNGFNPKPKWINTPAKLNNLITILLQQPLVAVDTESDSLYSYFEKVCLIQFSIPGKDYLVDPLAMDVSNLALLFANETIQKIFHAAEYDFLSLKRDYGFEFYNLFDTMIAARILGWNRFGLAPLLKEYFGVELDKRFQRYNWGQRPLGQKALEYAHLDTHYLIQLRQIQLSALNAQNREREATEAFNRLTQVEPTPKTFNPDDFWRIKHARDLKPQQQAVLRELFILRDKIARKLDRPPFKILNDRTLIEITKIQPQKPQELKHIKGVGTKFAQYNGTDVIEAIQNGKNAPLPHYTTNNNHRPDNRTMSRYETLRQWRNDRAAERGVEPDVIISNHTLMDIARLNPKSLNNLTTMGILGEWQQETYGKELVTLLKSTSH